MAVGADNKEVDQKVGELNFRLTFILELTNKKRARNFFTLEVSVTVIFDRVIQQSNRCKIVIRTVSTTL